MSTEPHWKGRGIAAAAVARKAREATHTPRDYVMEAIESLRNGPTNDKGELEMIRNNIGSIVQGIIIAQAIDRLGDRIAEAASIANYKRQ